MIDFYYNTGPNPAKVALLLEEAGLPYRPIPVDMARGEQLAERVTRLNPNGKVPIIVDEDGTIVFDSNAILLYLAERHGGFLPDPRHRGDTLSWLMFVASGLGPYSGQAVHFRYFAPEPKDYALQRYDFEARRHLGILDQYLAEREWMIDGDLSIVDMAVWGWTRNAARVLGTDPQADYPNLARHTDAISARPAAQRVVAMLAQHALKLDFDEEARRYLFRHITPA